MNTLRSVLMILALVAGISAPSWAQSDLRFADLGQCQLESGDTINGCKIGYRIFGALNSERSNAVLFPTWFTGTSEQLINLIGPGKLVDNSKFFVVAVDAFGNGVSSSPSNSSGHAEATFPRVTIRDMVRAQHRFVREVLGLEHLHAVMGISMGGMQAFEWAVSYPTFMDKAVPIVGSPRLASYDLLLWEALARLIEQCGSAGCENSGELFNLVVSVVSYTPQERVRRTPRERVPVLLENAEKQGRTGFEAANTLSQLKAMLTHDVAALSGGSLEQAAAAVRAELLVVNASQDHAVRPEPARDFARLVGAQVYESSSDCGHAIFACETAAMGQVIDAFLTRPRKSASATQ